MRIGQGVDVHAFGDGDKIVIGMGAGSISNWIRDLPKHIK